MCCKVKLVGKFASRAEVEALWDEHEHPQTAAGRIALAPTPPPRLELELIVVENACVMTRSTSTSTAREAHACCSGSLLCDAGMDLPPTARQHAQRQFRPQHHAATPAPVSNARRRCPGGDDLRQCLGLAVTGTAAGEDLCGLLCSAACSSARRACRIPPPRHDLAMAPVVEAVSPLLSDRS